MQIGMKSMTERLVRRWRGSTLLVACLLGVLAGITGAGISLEHTLADLRYTLRSQSSSGELHLVEIDARSIEAIDHWPWPRAHYARLVDELHRAGASSIAFDVDFSTPSIPREDMLFAQALARANGGVILPTFRQPSGTGQTSYIDSMPIDMLRAHSQAATVSIRPEAGGAVRKAPLGQITEGMPRPSLAALIAGRQGAADAAFPIDFAIDPASIPRHSFIDIASGRFDPTELKGKHVLVGATAIELGDRYAVPRFGVIPGAVIQALATLTLIEGVPIEAGWLLPLTLTLIVSWLMLRERRVERFGMAAAVAPPALFALSLCASEWGYEFSLVPSYIALSTVVAAASALCVRRWLAEKRTHDEQTGLPNRHALLATLHGQESYGVVTARIAEYDKALAALGQRGVSELINRVRDRISVLGSGVTVYRIGDRVLAWQATVEARDVPIRCEQLRALMLNPVEARGRKVDVSIAIGYAQGSLGSEAETIDNAFLAADLALSRGQPFHIHEDTDSAIVEDELSLLSDLDNALLAGDVSVVYQPKLDLSSGVITSAEALVRWNHSTRGPLRPDYFIPIVEKSDRICSLTIYVLRRAIADLKLWNTGCPALRVAVNISATLLESPAFMDELQIVLQDTGVEPQNLIFEVTESATMTGHDRAAEALLALKEIGIAISVDDYGTGQSTLTYLKKLTLDELKIDRSFVEHAHQNRSDAVLVRSTIDMAHELGLKVVAEGVETAECLDFLRSVGCDMAQGYLISRPVPPSRFGELLAEYRLAA
ncbi:putative bifunctional diguanylate cyclase/phosphodiesterase [Novosphingobium sp. M1R2S20]|uniref:Bifunctional diguanylate cyclase/phosphodiesterase n=1 Tax=Novosphingobium rhizovicinum TaxID=3228928 RepID=A0ABV3RIA5_9SPHN